MSGGVLSSTNGIYIGYSGNGLFNQSGGTVTTGNAGIAVADGLSLQYYGNGTYSLTAGILSIGGSLLVGGSTMAPSIRWVGLSPLVGAR